MTLRTVQLAGQLTVQGEDHQAGGVPQRIISNCELWIVWKNSSQVLLLSNCPTGTQHLLANWVLSRSFFHIAVSTVRHSMICGLFRYPPAQTSPQIKLDSMAVWLQNINMIYSIHMITYIYALKKMWSLVAQSQMIPFSVFWRHLPAHKNGGENCKHL